MRFARWVFWIATVYGVVVIAPNFWLEERLGRDYPPPITHSEFFYGFLGAALAWQVMYALIGVDPSRYRPAMLIAAAAKLAFALATLMLYQQGRTPGIAVALATPDAVLGLLFVVAWKRTPSWSEFGH